MTEDKEELEWLVGFDWASGTHVACLLDRNGRAIEERNIAHRGAELSFRFGRPALALPAGRKIADPSSRRNLVRKDWLVAPVQFCLWSCTTSLEYGRVN